MIRTRLRHTDDRERSHCGYGYAHLALGLRICAAHGRRVEEITELKEPKEVAGCPPERQ